MDNSSISTPIYYLHNGYTRKANTQITLRFHDAILRYYLQASLMVTAVVPHVAGTVYDWFGSLSHLIVPSLATWIYL
jgi:hypothetical protein